ncbi:MAG: bifunctional 4-hydroxy-2-oxoglutarate aldolase/2-dehydro-3-deoxy-phosphogluconate aldolase [Oscillospiraceae bacterium]|nr:bifunctional 4-hydroxy-2-oxoglutarate aldolase/2-dehydro-3-deoxy-phosphogluconate aldolase [Oscillospiraceae bacterium]
MNKILDKINMIGIVPVVVLNNAEDAVPLAKALLEGGLPCAEVTFRTAAAEESIKKIKEAYPEMFVGAGTVLTTEQVDRAISAGAEFIVTPGINPSVVKYCVDKCIPIVPGIATPSEIEIALSFGLDVVKFFPAEGSGGLSMIKDLAGPYTTMKFIPTGGINEKNIGTYLAYDKIVACGGSFMVKKELVAAKDFDKIKELTKEAVQLVLGFELKHVGINCENDEEADSVASSFDNLFGFKKRIDPTSIFAGGFIEAMKGPGLGKKGHIAIGTNNVSRAMNYLESKGIHFNMDSAKMVNGKITVIYLEEEIGGFAVHLTQK